jgi:WD40 repeat protein
MSRSISLGLVYVLLAPAVIAAQDAPKRDQHGDPLPPGAMARLGTVRWRHEEAIVFAAFLQDGKGVVSVSLDQTIHVWEFPSGKEIRRIALAADGSPPPLAGPNRPAVDLSSDGRVIATYFRNLNQRRIRLHDVGSGKELPSLPVTQVTITKLLFLNSPDRLLSLDFDGTAHVWDLTNGKELRNFAGPKLLSGPVVRNELFVSSPDGNTLMHMARGSLEKGTRAPTRDANTLRFINVNTGKEIGAGGESATLVSVQFTAAGKEIVTQADDGSTRRWDARTGRELGLIRPPTDPPNARLLPQRSIVVSPDGQVIAVAQRAVRPSSLDLIDGNTGKTLSTLALADRIDGRPKSLVFGPGNKLLAVNHQLPLLLDREKDDYKGTIELFDVAKGELLHTFTVSFDAPNTRITRRPSEVTLFSPDGKLLAWSVDGKTLHLWDMLSGRKIGSLALPSDVTMGGASFTPDGRCLALEKTGGGAQLFELSAGASRCQYGKSDAANVKAPSLLIESGLPGSITQGSSPHVAVSGNGKLLALAGPDKVLRVWDIDTGAELATFRNGGVKLTGVAFSPDSSTLATTCADTTALVWDLAQANPPATALPGNNLGMEECWQTLAGIDAEKAFRAIRAMAATPAGAIAFLKVHLEPARKVDVKRIEEFVSQLNHEQYKVRERAISELNKMGEQIVPALDKALAANPTLESKLRLQGLRNRMTTMPLKGDRLRAVRAVEVLERIGTPQARQVLEALATGDPGAILTSSAREALER